MRRILGLHLIQKHKKSEAEAKEYVANEEVHVRLKSTVTQTFFFDQQKVYRTDERTCQDKLIAFQGNLKLEAGEAWGSKHMVWFAKDDDGKRNIVRLGDMMTHKKIFECNWDCGKIVKTSGLEKMQRHLIEEHC